MKTEDALEETSLLRGQVTVMQPREGFRASLDSVLLAVAALPYAQIHQGHPVRILEMGCGVGSVSLCIASKNKNISLIGIDFNEKSVETARLNLSVNNLDQYIDFKVKNVSEGVGHLANTFDLVVTNPPYLLAGAHAPSPSPNKATAHGEAVSLEEWLAFAHKALRQAGRLVMVHRADRLDHIIRVLTARRWFGSLIVQPIQPYADTPAKRVLISAVKERYAPLRLNPPLVIHQPGGSYTEKAARLFDGLDVLWLEPEKAISSR